jgi:hypothetical protein
MGAESPLEVQISPAEFEDLLAEIRLAPSPYLLVDCDTEEVPESLKEIFRKIIHGFEDDPDYATRVELFLLCELDKMFSRRVL